MHKFKYKKYYFINEYDTNLIKNVDKSINIIYRNYDEKIDLKKILNLKNFCKKRGTNFFLSNNIKLAISLQLDGVYLPSFNNEMKHLSYNFKKKFKIIGSAHSLKEIKIKEIQGVEIIFLSSLFKNNKNYLGINKFKLLSRLSRTKIVALGGLGFQNIKKLYLLNVRGFAGITMFKKKGP